MWTISQGVGDDPWTAGRPCTVEPEIDPSAVVKNSRFGVYTFVGPNSQVFDSAIDDYGYAMGGNQIVHATLGKFANIATGVRVNPSNHPWWRATLHHVTYRSRSYGFDLDDDAGLFQWRAEDHVTIGPDVWLGHNSIVMPGVTIGAGAAIGSGAVVTKDVPPYAVMVGVPARVLRLRVDELTAERLMALAWWDWDRARLEAAMPDLRALDAKAFVDKYGR